MFSRFKKNKYDDFFLKLDTLFSLHDVHYIDFNYIIIEGISNL